MNIQVIKLLLWKSWKIRSHHKVWFAIWFAIPIIFSLFMIYVNSGTRISEDSSDFNRQSLSATHTTPQHILKPFDTYDTLRILFCPQNNYTQRLMRTVRENLIGKVSSNQIGISGRDSEQSIRIEMKKRTKFLIEKLIGIVFDYDNVYTSADTPLHLKYKIIIDYRSDAHSYFNKGKQYVTPEYYQSSKHNSDYIGSGFSEMQTVIDLAHISLTTSNVNVTQINIMHQQFPIPSRTRLINNPKPGFTQSIVTIIFIIITSLVVMLPVIVKRVVEEKHTNIADYLMVMGVRKREYWISVIIDAIFILAIQFAIIAIMFETIPIYTVYPSLLSGLFSEPIKEYSLPLLMHVNFSLFLVFLYTYLIQSILFVCFISMFFNNPNIAVIVTILIWIFSFVLPISYFYLYPTIFDDIVLLELWGLELLSCFLPNCALFWMFWIMFGLNKDTIYGPTWYHIADPGYFMDQISLIHVWFAMLVSYIFYAVLIWYISEVWPFQHRSTKPVYFPIKQLYEYFVKKYSQPLYETMDETENNPLVIKNINKSYKSTFGFKYKSVLKDIHIETENNSIIVLLGPNGSGKTTLINIMTGLTESDCGYVKLCSNDTVKDKRLAQNTIGFCPQNNVYYKYLTINDHLQLFYNLKKALRQQISGYTPENLISLLDLTSDANKEALKLSGGTMRRLVLAMAMIGKNDILLLDEPTAGLDAIVRRKVWDLLVETRKSCSIMITTHHLDEANILADNIAILVYGELKFIGSTLQMKKQFGTGYQIKILKSKEMQTESQINALVTKYAKKFAFTKYEMSDNEELKYSIDFENSGQFGLLFSELELNSKALGIFGQSLSLTTLEDSYAKIMRQNDTVSDNYEIEEEDSDKSFFQTTAHYDRRRTKHFKLIMLQMYGIFVKRLQYCSKHYILVIPLCVIPILMLSLVFIVFAGVEHFSRNFYKEQTLENKLIYGSDIKSFIISNQNIDQNFLNIYSNLMNENGITINRLGYNDIQQSLLDFSTHDLNNYYFKFLYGMSTDYGTKDNITIWYNTAAYQSLPISLNLATNALLRNLTNNEKLGITVIESPPNFDRNGVDNQIMHLLYALFSNFAHINELIFILMMAFTISSYVLLPVVEKTSKFKLLQLMSGVNPIIYWTANLSFDLTLHAICSLLYALAYAIYDFSGYFVSSMQSFIAVYLMFFFYGFAFIPFVYYISFYASKPSTAFTFISLFNIIGTIIGILIVNFILYSFKYFLDDYETGNILSNVFVELFPQIIFPTGLSAIHKLNIYNTICERFERIDPLKSYCNYNTTGLEFCCPNICETDMKSEIFPEYYITTYQQLPDYTFSKPVPLYYGCHKYFDPVSYGVSFYTRFIITGVLFLIIIMSREFRLRNKLKYLVTQRLFRNRNNDNIELQEYECEDVAQESHYVTQLIRNRDLDSAALIVDRLTKRYNKSAIIPNNISFSVHKEECFGLLGVNGSGKSTTLRLLTGEIDVTSGNAYLGSNASLIENSANFFANIGYCPQNDALLDRLTAMQTLTLFSRLRGLDTSTYCTHINTIAKTFGLSTIINQTLSTYSGGNRRKLSLAIALIGSPSLLLLDEPTTGVDPDSRLKIWQLLRNLLDKNKVSILLTSHNMDECESLCTRLAIISSGKLSWIGFTSDLKKKYANGFILILKVSFDCSVDSVVNDLKCKMREVFGEKCLLKYWNNSVIYYHYDTDCAQLSQIFKSLEIVAQHFNLEDYFVSNANLEQAFLYFAQQNQPQITDS